MLTDQPVSADTTGSDNHKTQREDGIEGDLLSLWYVEVPCDDARQCNGVKIADCSADASQRVDDCGIEAAELLCHHILDVEGFPISFRWSAVRQKHDAEGKGIRNGEADREPDSPLPTPRICTVDQATIEEEDRHLGKSSTKKKG